MARISLKIAIVESGKSQRQLAAECQPRISENRFSEIVCGWVDPRAAEQTAIALALGRRVEELFGVAPAARVVR